MSENNMGSGDAAASIKSEKSKDIRSTNIIAAKGKCIPPLLRTSDCQLTSFYCFSRR